MRKISLFLVCSMCCIFQLQAMVHYVNLNATGTSDGTTWTNAFTDLQAAIDAAQSGDSIFVATATYQPASGSSFVMKDGVKIFGGFTGEEAGFNQRNLNSKATLKGNGASVINNYQISAAGIWDGFIVTGGNASVSGGMDITDASPTIRNCVFSGNTATSGGGMGNYDNSTPTIINCVFSGNIGGGMYNSYNSFPTIINCTFAGNSAYAGGAIANYNSGCTLINCIIWGNTATYQGNSIYNSQSTATVTYSDVQDVTAGTGNISMDPLFVAPSSSTVPFNDGDYRLQTGSPAIDAGSSAANTLTTDLAGNPRIRASAIEMGAYENTPLSRVVYVDQSVAASGDGSSWTEAYKTLSDALHSSAISFTTIDSILVAQGSYYPTGLQNSTDRDSSFLILRSGIKIYGGYPAGGGVRDIEANPTMLSGNIGNEDDSLDNSVHVLVMAGIYESADSVVLDGLTFRNASTSSIANSTKTYNGVAVLRTAGGGVNTTGNQSDHIAFRNCTFSNNILHVSIGGGGMYNEASSPLVSNCIFTNNTGNGSGGGMFNAGASPVIDYCTFSNNNVGSNGAGLYNYDGSSPVITNCTFNFNINNGTGGAGMFNSSSTPTVINCTFSENVSTNVATTNTGGAGMYNLNCSPIITECSFTNNVISGLGGGGMMNNNASPSVTDCIFSGNLGQYTASGAGMYNMAASAPVITNSLFSGNVGGAVNNSEATATFTNCTIAGNYNGYGGGVVNYNSTPDPVFQNTIVWGNIGSFGANGVGDLQSTSVFVNCDIQEITGGTDGNISEDPLFVNAPVASPATFLDGDYQLQEGSPAINAGNNAALPANGTLDLAGNPRIASNTVDMGAYEYITGAPLPLQLLSFKGALVNGQTILQWRTTDEKGLSYFNLEKSTDGKSFSFLDKINAAGEGDNTYSFTDYNPSKGNNFYRLRLMVDDGGAGYSNIVLVNNAQGKIPEFSLYPNPAGQVCILKTESISANAHITITDFTGRKVYEQKVQPGMTVLDVSMLANGVYDIILSDNKQANRSKKLVIAD